MTAFAEMQGRSEDPPGWAAGLFTSALAPQGLRSDGAIGTWRIDGDTSTSRTTHQFRSGAGEYHARYANSAHFEALLTQALNATGVSIAERPQILDLGSGSGVNSIVPCLNLFPGARQVATDLSGEMLAMLAEYARDAGFADDVVCVVMDAMSDHVAPGQFDLVTGASILHHLINPNLGLEVAARALKPGGHAIFFEPFDGYGLMRLAYERILAEAELRRRPWRRPLAEEIERALRAMVADIAVRTMPDPSAPGFADLDDKWLFSRQQLEDGARARGFTKVRFVPHNDHSTLFRDVAAVQMRLSTGSDELKLPDWAIAILDQFDRALPPPAKRLLMLEGTIVLTKAV